MENTKEPVGTTENQSRGVSGGNKPTGGMPKALKWLIGLIILGAVGYGGWYLGQSQKSNLKSQNDNSKVKNIEIPITQKTTTQQSSTTTPTTITKETQNNTTNKLYKLSYSNKNFYSFNLQFEKQDDVLITGNYEGEGGPSVNLELFNKNDDFGYSPLRTTVQINQYPENPPSKEDLKTSIESDSDNINLKEVEIDGGQGFSYTIGGFCSGKETKFIKGKYLTTLRTYCSTRESDYDQILSTFKFTP